MVGEISNYIRTDNTGNSWTWSCTAFKSWKKRLKQEYLEKEGRSLNSDMPSSGDREALYKRVFEMEGLDIFDNGNVNQTRDRTIDSIILKTCIEIRDLI